MKRESVPFLFVPRAGSVAGPRFAMPDATPFLFNVFPNIHEERGKRGRSETVNRGPC